MGHLVNQPHERERWIAEVAPNAARRLFGGDDSTIRIAWSLMLDDYKTAVWRLLNREQRQIVRKALDGAVPSDIEKVPA
jgi:hypothetical protein